MSGSTLRDIVCSLVLDGVTPNVISKSPVIHHYCNLRCFNLPKNPTNIMKLVFEKETEVLDLLKLEIKELKKCDTKFAISLDEATTKQNRRFLNVILYLKDCSPTNLGLIRIQSSCPAQTMVELVGKRLEEFDLDIHHDIIVVISDGAAVMIRFASLINAFLIICMNHTIHLAITDVFYKRCTEPTIDTEEDEDDCLENFDDDEDLELGPEEENDDNIAYEESASFRDTLTKLRTVAKLFKRSPVKNGLLQRAVIETHGKELSLLLDSKTRWNSIIPMVKRYVTLKNEVAGTLTQLNKAELTLTENEVSNLIEIINVLEPVEILVNELSRRSTNLLAADVSIEFTLRHLRSLKTDISSRMVTALKERLGGPRRNNSLVSLIKYLYNSNVHSIKNDDFFKMATKSDIAATCLKILSKSQNDEESSDSEDLEEETQQPEEMDYKKQMQKSIANYLSTTKQNNLKTLSIAAIKRDMNYYEANHSLPNNLSILKNLLSSVPPTSIEPERTFSLTDFFITKRRCRLSDASINALIFLKTNTK